MNDTMFSAAACSVPALRSVVLRSRVARPRPRPAIGRVVVVGGGFWWRHRGALPEDVGRQCRRDAGRAQPPFVSCRSPTSCWAATSRSASFAQLRRPEGAGREAGAGASDRHRCGCQRVKLADGSTLAYDRLVVSPGVDFATEANGRPRRAVAAQAKFLHAGRPARRPSPAPADRGGDEGRRRLRHLHPQGAFLLPPGPRADTAWSPSTRRRSFCQRCWCSTPTPRSSEEGAVRRAFRIATAASSNTGRTPSEGSRRGQQHGQAQFGRQTDNAQPHPAAARRRRRRTRAGQRQQPLGGRELAEHGSTALPACVLGDATFPAPTIKSQPHGQPAHQGGGGGDHPAAQRGEER